VKQQPLTYIAQTQPGFEAITAEELYELVGNYKHLGTRTIGDKNGMLMFGYKGDPLDLMDLRTTEDIFIEIARVQNLPPVPVALRLIKEAVAKANIDPALNILRQLQPNRGGRGKFRFRVVARQIGETAYRRVDAQIAVEKAILNRSDHRWALAEENAIEFWLTLVQNEAIIALRLTDETMRHRKYKIEHMPASLRPTAAAAMVWLTRPRDNDVFLDPMCGAGTILIERAQAGRYAQLYGGDIRGEALKIASNNIGTRYQPIELKKWDAKSLPIDESSIDAAAINLPFGGQIGSTQENQSLYPAVMREMTRVLRSGSRLVLLTSDRRSMGEALNRASQFQQLQQFPVQVLGKFATIYVLQRV
jgi:tRNA (guanine6-N2)-methyltransferase